MKNNYKNLSVKHNIIMLRKPKVMLNMYKIYYFLDRNLIIIYIILLIMTYIFFLINQDIYLSFTKINNIDNLVKPINLDLRLEIDIKTNNINARELENDNITINKYINYYSQKFMNTILGKDMYYVPSYFQSKPSLVIYNKDISFFLFKSSFSSYNSISELPYIVRGSPSIIQNLPITISNLLYNTSNSSISISGITPEILDQLNSNTISKIENISSSSIIERRGLGNIYIELPENPSKSYSLYQQLDSILKELNLYKIQANKFITIMVNTNKGIESFYPPESTELFWKYLILLDNLMINLRSSANNIITQIQIINPGYIPPSF